jgi:hypothetical protein
MPPADTRSTIQMLRDAADFVPTDAEAAEYEARASHLEALLASQRETCRARWQAHHEYALSGMDAMNDPPSSPPGDAARKNFEQLVEAAGDLPSSFMAAACNCRTPGVGIQRNTCLSPLRAVCDCECHAEATVREGETT